MEIQQLNAYDADKIFVAFRNVDGSGSITQNEPVVLALDGNSVNGNAAIKPASATVYAGWIGVADRTVAINGYGRAQAWGYRDSIKISNETTSITITGGDVLGPVAGAVGLSSVGGATLSYANLPYAVATQTLTLSQGQVYCSGFLRCI
jgi:hypothetical protein